MPFSATIEVAGEPKTKGSWRIVPRRGTRPVIRRSALGAEGKLYQIRDLVLIPDVRKGYESWVKAIKQAAARQAPPQPLDCPVSVVATFILPQPQKPKFDCPAVPPDVDKLLRAVLDALTGVVFKDDARVVSATARKVYRHPPGVTITVEALGATQENLF